MKTNLVRGENGGYFSAMETTVRALARARVRHFVLGVLFAVAAGGALRAGSTLDAKRAQAHRSAVAQLSIGKRSTPPGGAIEKVPASSSTITVLTWFALVCSVAAWYHLREWRGKTRRYHNQRHRAANEELRADFRRSQPF